MDKSDIQLIFAYNRWANERVLAACGGLTAEQMHAPAQCSFGSLMGTLAHIYSAERSWRLRLEEGISPGRLQSGADFGVLGDLERVWEEEMTRMERFTSSLDGADLERWVEYTTTSGRLQASTLWKALAHVAFHGTQFRAEAGAVMASLDSSPGDLDFILYLREVDQR